jgi:two-component system phosphate regulon sensor histidine kinase PhoR
VKIVVKDNGIGIAEEEMPYIFEPFYRVEKSRSQHIKGYGLGLNLCRMIMETHRGKIEVQSKEGAGTTVLLFFPEAGPSG